MEKRHLLSGVTCFVGLGRFGCYFLVRVDSLRYTRYLSARAV